MKNREGTTGLPRNCIAMLWPVLFMPAPGGCQRPVATDEMMPVLQLRTHYPSQSWKCRLTGESNLPANMLRKLCDEHQAICVSDAHQWQELTRALNLENVDPAPDFERGMVVGVASSLGRPISSAWPLDIEYVKQRQGVGSLAVRIEQGLYEPVRSSPYCVLTYVPALERLALVRINHRLFYLD